MDLVMPHSNKAEAYLQFMSSRLSLRDRAGLPSLDPLEERLLEMVALASEPGERLSVTEVITTSELGSPTTLHSRLKSLRGKGLIELAYTDEATRRQLQLTTAGMSYLDVLAKCMVAAVK
jgi:DNA-binding transcriptional ArsR family regulator